MIVQAPDNKTIDFGDMPSDQVMAAMQKLYPPEQPGFFSRLGSDLSNRNQMVQGAVDQYQSGNLSSPETLLQGTGKGVFGAANDVVGESVKSAINYTPDFIKQPIANAANSLAKTGFGQGVIGLAKQGGDLYSQFAQNHPRIAGDAEAVGNIVTGLPAAGLEKAIAGEAADLTGQALSKTGNTLINSADKTRNAYVKDLVTPKITPTVAQDQFSRSTEQGLLRRAIVDSTPQEKAMIDTVSQLPVSGSKSLLANYNIISEANSSEAEALIAKLKENDVAIPDDHILNTLSDIRENLSNSPYVTGDGAKAADKVINIALNTITNNEGTASGLLQARKDFDAEISRMKGDKTFNPTLDSPVTAAVQQVRQGINKMVDDAVPSVEVKQSLSKQSNMYRAMDNIETKGGAEGKNIFSRAAQKAADFIPVKSAMAKGALALGAAGLAASAPALATAGLGIYGAGKALNSEFVKRNAGKVLRGAGNVMRK